MESMKFVGNTLIITVAVVTAVIISFVVTGRGLSPEEAQEFAPFFC
jgi:hypothetical protein